MKFITQENGSIKVVAESNEEKEMMAANHRFWEENKCKCDEQEDNDAYYVEDNTPGALVEKHHWLCSKCHGLVQIG